MPISQRLTSVKDWLKSWLCLFGHRKPRFYYRSDPHIYIYWNIYKCDNCGVVYHQEPKK